MGYERYPRGSDRRGDFYNRSQDQDYGRDYGSGRDYSYSSARDYGAAGQFGDRDSYGSRDDDREEWGRSGFGRQQQGYGRDRDYGRSHGYGPQGYGSQGYGSQGYGAQGYGSQGSGLRSSGREDDRYGSRYGANTEGRRSFEQDRGSPQRGRGFSGQPQGYDYDDRGFFDRAGDEVRSWFGDDEAERRREMDRRYDERQARDDHYGNWRQQRINELDRDYDEYRRENASKFENEFNSFRTERQTQRDCLNKVNEHMEVVGSDGQHVGTVDKVRGDRIILTKSDPDAGGRHHSVPSRWIQSVDDKVMLRKSSDEAKREWRDEERNQAMFRDDHESRGDTTAGSRNLNRSFSGTY